MSDEYDLLIQEISRKHGITLGRDDPILILQTFNKMLLEQNVKAQQTLFDDYKQEMAKLTQHWSTQLQQQTHQILQNWQQMNEQQLSETLQSTTDHIRPLIVQQLNDIFNQITLILRDTRHLIIANLLASFLTLGAAALAIWAHF